MQQEYRNAKYLKVFSENTQALTRTENSFVNACYMCEQHVTVLIKLPMY